MGSASLSSSFKEDSGGKFSGEWARLSLPGCSPEAETALRTGEEALRAGEVRVATEAAGDGGGGGVGWRGDAGRQTAAG